MDIQSGKSKKHQHKINIKDKELVWFGHVQRKPEAKLSKQVLQWKPGGRGKQGWARRNWRSGINGYIREEGIEDRWNGDMKSKGVGRHNSFWTLVFDFDPILTHVIYVLAMRNRFKYQCSSSKSLSEQTFSRCCNGMKLLY